MSGEKKKLSISPCDVNADGSVTVRQGEKLEVMINPASYSLQKTISYNSGKAIGQMGVGQDFSAVDPEKVSFDLVFDGTGVVDSGQTEVKDLVSQLNDIVYLYDGNKHEPNHVRLLWGSLIFFGRLETMSLEYTLFKPNGEPLRAKVKLAFKGFMSKQEEVLRANRSSPDLTHIVEVKAGDTLPGLCYRIYKDSSYYSDVARINNLPSFRVLKPGTRLSFPPLR